MTAYEDTLSDIEETLGLVPGFMKALPEDVLVHDWPLMKRYQFGDSVIPPKYREMMGLAVAANLKCPYCQLLHLAMAQARGASEEELSELDFLASFTARWSAMLHAQNYDMDQFREEASRIGNYLSKEQTKITASIR